MIKLVTASVVIDLEVLRALRREYNFSISDLATRLGYKTPTGYWSEMR